MKTDKERIKELEAEVARLKTNIGCAREQGSTQYCAEVLGRDKRIAELEAALQAVRDWYDRDGSVGGCDNLMEDIVEPFTRRSQP